MIDEDYKYGMKLWLKNQEWYIRNLENAIEYYKNAIECDNSSLDLSIRISKERLSKARLNFEEYLKDNDK